MRRPAACVELDRARRVGPSPREEQRRDVPPPRCCSLTPCGQPPLKLTGAATSAGPGAADAGRGWHRARRDAGRWCVSVRRGLDPERYHKKAYASEATASQMAAQIASDRTNTALKDAPSER